ncbi:MAG: 4-vinyl reductase [Chloroflexota bacterium]
MPDFSPRLLRAFVETLSAELGADNLSAVLEKAGLSLPDLDPKAGAPIPASASGQAYADLQRALRTYYGRGARGILLRVGAQLWKRLLNEAPLTMKPQISLARGLATKERPKPALDLLAKLFSTNPGDLAVHTLDLDLLLVDHPSPAANGQRDNEPICWTTVGLIREALHWSSGREFDVTEISCRALGASQCEFKVISS